MSTVSIIIFALWGISILAESTAFGMLVHRRLWHRYPILTAYLGLDALRGLLRLHSYLIAGSAGFRARWLHTQSFEFAILAVLVIEGYVVQARPLNRHFLRPGTVLMVIFTAIALGAVYSTSSIGVLSGSTSPTKLLFERYFESVCFVVVALYRLFFRHMLVESSANVAKHGRLLLILFGGGALATLMGQWNQWTTTAIGQFVLMGTQIFAYVSWAGFLLVFRRRVGRILPNVCVSWAGFNWAGEEPGARPPEMTGEEMRRADEEWRSLNRRIRDLWRRRR